MFIMITVFFFASLKLQHLLERASPQINTYTMEEYDSESIELDTSVHEFAMAFGLEDAATGLLKGDTQYLKWFATVVEVDSGRGSITRGIPLHECTEEDFKRFAPPDKRFATRIESYK